MDDVRTTFQVARRLEPCCLPHILVAPDLRPAERALCYLLPQLDFEVTNLYDEGQAVAKLLGHDGDPKRYLLITTSGGEIEGDDENTPPICAERLIKRLRLLNYPGKIHVCCWQPGAEELRAFKQLKVDRIFPFSSNSASLVDNIELLIREAQPFEDCLSILQTEMVDE